MSPTMLQSASIFQGASPFEVSSYVQRHIGNHHIELRGGTGRAMLCHKRFGALGLSQLSYGERAVVSTTTGLAHSYHLQVVIAGDCTVHHKGKEAFTLTPGTATLINPQDLVSLEYSDDCVKLIVNLPTDLVSDCYREQVGELPAGGLRFDTQVFRLDQSASFSKWLELLFLEADQHVVDTSRLGAPMGVLVASKLIDAFCHPLPRLGGDADFFCMIDRLIDERARSDITTEELASLCNVSVRTLYERFKRADRVSPHAYIKARRLRQVREAIRGAHGKVRNVTQVALDFGFNHLGRFSSEYKGLFGELPSETLRRRTG